MGESAKWEIFLKFIILTLRPLCLVPYYLHQALSTSILVLLVYTLGCWSEYTRSCVIFAFFQHVRATLGGGSPPQFVKGKIFWLIVCGVNFCIAHQSHRKANKNPLFCVTWSSLTIWILHNVSEHKWCFCYIPTSCLCSLSFSSDANIGQTSRHRYNFGI